MRKLSAIFTSDNVTGIIKKAAAIMGTALIITTSFCTAASAADSATTYKFSDISLEVSVPDELVGFTRNVTSNNAYLDRVGTDDVEELRSLMITNNIYLEAIPKTKDINYEILINGKDADSEIKDFNETDDNTLTSMFNEYVKACDNIDNSSVTENVTSSQMYTNNTTSYFVVDVKSVANNKVTTYVRKYYTVMMGKSITYTIQSNGAEISEDAASTLLSIVNSAQYHTIKKSAMDNQFVSEIFTNVITVLVPILILALIVFIVNKSTKKTKKQIEADEERYRAAYAAREAEKNAEKLSDKTES